MSLKSTKEQLIQLLADKDNKVIALSGKWGTGKSHMWDEVKKSSADVDVQNALYASLFGLSTIEQIKIKLLQSAVPSMKANPHLWKSATEVYKTGVKALEGVHKSLGALNDIGLIFAPAMLNNKIIVLDDLERKHERLNIDEVLGFIDEFTQQHDSRFVLILNSDKLDQRKIWDTFREKVIDEELRLNTSTEEAFKIAVGLSPSKYEATIQCSVELCKLTNIRVIQKIIKAINRILGNREDLSEAVLYRVIPSTVLLAAIHYKGIDDGPDFDFVLSQGSDRDWSVLHDKKVEETEESKRKSKWKLLTTELGIRGCDDFELVVIEYLESGLFDVSMVTAIVDRYIAEEDALEARNACNKFLERLAWDYRMNEAQLLEEAALVVAKAHLLDPYMVSSLHENITEIPGGQQIADAAVAGWIEAFRARNLEEAELNNFFNRKIHHLIESEFNNINNKAQVKTTILDACFYVAKNSAWGARQELAFKSATIQDIESIILNSGISDLKFFMFKMLDMCIHRKTYESYLNPCSFFL
ncbi:hypothetical protein KEF85_12115 [Methylomonas paludis]|uniref:KAP NTPase domain-containing protein n=1 Tax=Methylomonas paludis TaxID=1173101 RepID=A0A975MLM7_9GAMM|nr:P-loop NTPase fold protein [Methylomonas paludis]QWF70090.1 hypothetical protein KEF85_12115 [Methylomonas paludis]